LATPPLPSAREEGLITLQAKCWYIARHTHCYHFAITFHAKWQSEQCEAIKALINVIDDEGAPPTPFHSVYLDLSQGLELV